MLSKRWLRLGWLGALALALAAGSCDSPNGAVSRIVEPQFNHADQKKPEKVKESSSQRGGNTHSARVIGSDGGVIEFRGHRLTVPAGAVSAPTLFKISQVHGGYIEVDLRAIQQTSGTAAEVGASGFARPVTLELSFARAEGIASIERLAIGWVRDDGTIELLPSVVDPVNRMVRAELDHFSKYAMVAN